MSKVRVYELAKQYNMDQKSLVALFQSSGVNDVRNHMSAIEQEVADRILKRHLERQRAFGAETRIDREQFREAVQQQSRARQQRDGQRDFRDHDRPLRAIGRRSQPRPAAA